MADERTRDNGDEIDINLRSPREAAERMIVLGSVCRRTFLEERPEGVEDGDAEGERFDLAAWLIEEGIEAAATPRERGLLGTRVGGLLPDLVADASWQTEALLALGWALRLVETMPPYDAAADPAALLRVVPAPWESTEAFRRGAQLRDETEIAIERERAELWHWRAEVENLLRDAAVDRSEPLAAIEEVGREAAATGLVPSLLDGDFPVRGRPYRDAQPAVLGELGAVAAERVLALNWLSGFGTSWDDVPLDV